MSDSNRPSTITEETAREILGALRAVMTSLEQPAVGQRLNNTNRTISTAGPNHQAPQPVLDRVQAAVGTPAISVERNAPFRSNRTPSTPRPDHQVLQPVRDQVQATAGAIRTPAISGERNATFRSNRTPSTPRPDHQVLQPVRDQVQATAGAIRTPAISGGRNATFRRQSSLQEHSRLFRPFRNASRGPQPPKKKKISTFSRILICLPDCDQEVVPTKEEKAILKNNDLGEKLVTFEKEGDAFHVKEKILSAYQKEELELGFEIMTMRTRSRSVLEVVHTGPCSAQDLQLLSSQKIYVRPIQKNILLKENTPPSNQDLLPCYLCGIMFLTSELREHSEVCKILEETAVCDEALVVSDSDASSVGAIEVEREQPSDDEMPIVTLHELPQTTPSQNEEDLALEQILSKLKERSSDDTSVEELIKNFREEFVRGRRLNLPSDMASADAAMQGETYKIIISRLAVFQGVLDEFTARGYKPCLPLEVSFMGERGQDLGGLRKEFLRLALNAVYERLTINVPNEGRKLIEDQAGMIDQKAFLAAGIVMGQCILQDGPKPNFLEKALVDRLVEGSCTTQSEQQLLEGMRQTGILGLMRNFPKCRELLDFNVQPSVEAQELLDSFTPKFSEEGSNKRLHEEIVFGHFVRFIREVEAGSQHVDSREDGELLTLQHVLQFVTGLTSKPVCGWEPPLTVSFVAQDVSKMGIGASTCSHELHLPIPLNPVQPLPSRNIFFQLLSASFHDEYFGKD